MPGGSNAGRRSRRPPHPRARAVRPTMLRPQTGSPRSCLDISRPAADAPAADGVAHAAPDRDGESQRCSGRGRSRPLEERMSADPGGATGGRRRGSPLDPRRGLRRGLPVVWRTESRKSPGTSGRIGRCRRKHEPMASSREEGARPVAVRSDRRDGWRPAGQWGGVDRVFRRRASWERRVLRARASRLPFVIPAKAGIQASWERGRLARGGGSRAWTRGAAPAPHVEIWIRSPGPAAGFRERGGEGSPDRTLGHGLLGTRASRPHRAAAEPPWFVCGRDARVPRTQALSGGPCAHPEAPGERA